MSAPKLNPQQVFAAADRLPRVRLAHLPTPLEEAHRLSAWIGGGVRIFIKRDDCTGLVLGGNKARHNEFLMGDALNQGCDTLVWGAAVQSNNCRQTAAACAKLGLQCRLFLSRSMKFGLQHGSGDPEPQGNLLIDHLVGAVIEYTNAVIGPELDALLQQKAELARAEGRKPYVWDRSRVIPRAAASYALCVAELVQQFRERGMEPDAVYVSSSGATGAGVALGKALLGLQCPARLICPMHWPWHIPTALAQDANAAAELLSLPHRLRPEEIDADESYIAPGYGVPSAAGQEALHMLARTEAILLDPVYTAKALAALIADVRAGKYPRGSTIVFIHTGGVPAVFADPAQVLSCSPS